MKKQQSMPSSNIGMVSLLMIFIVLCLVTFATLSLSNTVSEYHYSQRLASKNQSYQKAVNRANRMLFELADGLQGTASADDFLAGIDSLNFEYDANLATASFAVEIDDSRNLAVTLRLDTDADRFTITGWNVVSTKTWEFDNSMNLMQ